MIPYFIVFFIIFILYVFKDNNITIFFICLMLILFAGLRSNNVDRDYNGYESYYNSVINNGWQATLVEPSFSLISMTVNFFSGNFRYLFILYAIIGVLLKIRGIILLSNNWILSVLLYFPSYFFLHEMTQIRVGVATGIFLISIVSIYNKAPLRFLLFLTLAIFFQFTAIVMLPIYFLNPNKFNKLIYSVLIPLGYIIFLSGINMFFFLDFLPINFINTKYESYSLNLNVNDLNLFNFLFLIRCIIAYFFIYHFNKIKNRYFILILKIYLIGLFLYLLLANFHTIGSRISEFLLIVEIILFPNIIFLFKSKKFAIFLTLIFSLSYLLYSLYFAKILDIYY